MQLNRPILFEKWWIQRNAAPGVGFSPAPKGETFGGCGQRIAVEKNLTPLARWWQVSSHWTTSSLWKRQTERWKCLRKVWTFYLPFSSCCLALVWTGEREPDSCFLLVSASESLWSCGLLAMLDEMLVFKDKHSSNALMKAGDFV